MIFAVQVTSADPAAWIPLLVLVIYLTVLLGLGWLGYRRSTGGEEDYYLAGRNQGWIVSSFTIMATFFSSFALLGAPGMVYREGVVFALVSLNVPVAGFCVYLFGDRIRRIGRQHGFVTQADMFCAHYDSQIVLRLLVSLVGFLFVMPYVMMQLKAGGELAAVMFPNYEYGFEIGAIVLSVITALYIMIGGMRSVAWTDAIQCLLLTAGMIAAGAALITSFGGLASFHAAVATLPDSSLTVPGNTGFWRVPTLFTVCLLMPIGGIIQPAQWMRFYSARDASTLRRSALIFIVLLTGCFLFGIMLVGLGGQALYPLEFSEGSVAPHNAVGSFDQILVTVIRDKLPEMLGPGLGFTMASLMIVAIMAAAMSTADSNLHALSALFTRDIYDRFIRPSATEHERVWVGRLVIIAATCASLGLVIIGSHPESSLFGFMQMIVDLALFAVAFSVQLLPMTIDTLFVRRGTKLGAIVGLMAGLVVAFCFTALFPLFVAVANGADGQGPLAVVLDWVTAAKNVLPIHATAWGLIPNALLFAVLSVRAGQRRARAMREKPAPI